MDFYSQYNRPSKEVCPQEICPDQGLVEKSGYVSTERMVRRLMDAGERLVAFREAEFAPEEEVPDDYEPVGPLSLLDALRLQKNVRERLMAQAKAKKVEAPPEKESAGAPAGAPAKEE